MAKLHNWLRGGKHSSECLTSIAAYVARRDVESVLDIGCGNGELLCLLEGRGVPCSGLYGCDIEPGHTECARGRTNLKTIITADIADGAPFNRTFDVACAINCLHNDWRSKHATAIPHGITPDRLHRIADAVSESVRCGGAFVFDWRGSSEEAMAFCELLTGWRFVEILNGRRDLSAFIYERR